MANKKLVKFMKEARKRGFSDLDIRNALINKGWPLDEIEKAFLELTPKYKFKNQVTIFLDNQILKALEKRAKKNMFTVGEQIEDILRRSCLNIKTTTSPKCDDTLVEIFSRQKKARKKKK
jgi:hypothetical protein